MGQQFVATAQHATDVGAYLYMILAHRGGAHKGVISDHVAHIEFGNPDPGGYFADHLVGEIANLILGVKEHGDQGRTTHRVNRHQTVEARGQGWTEDGVYRCAHSFQLTPRVDVPGNTQPSLRSVCHDRTGYQFSKSGRWASPIFFVPCTLVRTWGTRLVPPT